MDAEVSELGSGIESADCPVWRTAHCLSVREKKSRNGEALLSPSFLLSVYSFGIYIIARNFRSYSEVGCGQSPQKAIIMMPYLSCKKIENDVYNFPTWQYCKYKDIFDSIKIRHKYLFLIRKIYFP